MKISPTKWFNNKKHVRNFMEENLAAGDQQT